MKKLTVLTAILMAGSFVSMPIDVQAQERKTLFQVLFPKAHERKKRQLRQRNELVQQQQAAQARKNLPKVKTSKNYAYKVAKRGAISLKPAAVKFAAVTVISNQPENLETNPQPPAEQPKISLMTADIVDAGNLKLSAEKHIADALSEFYNENQDYVWVNDQGDWNAKARSVQRLFSDAESYGLRNSDYVTEAKIPVRDDKVEIASARLQNEIAMSVAMLRYAMDAEYGTINPNRLSGYHDFPLHNAKSGDMFDAVMGKGLPANNLRALHPTNEKFAALRSELEALSDVEDDLIELPTKILIKPGQSNPAMKDFVAAIEKRGTAELLEAHSETLSAYIGDEKYSPELVALVKDYQKEAGLGADGIIGRNTATRLAGVSSEKKVMQVKLAMERLRWLPDEFGARHVFINQPEYRARYIENGKENLSMRVVVGKKSNQTNFFYDQIEYVEYNPYWGVPRSIIVNEFLPKSLGNPGYLDQKGYEVATFGGKRISSSSINWSQVGANPNFSVRQPPGAKNALGQLKIMFPNKHAIYMHDTPAKSLFKRQHRAFSHGCVRLHDPQAMAAAVLGKSKAGIKAAIAQGKNQTEHLKTKVPVYVSYFTAWPQQNGEVKYFADMYGRDAHLIKAIKATEKARAISISS
ncbi:MAG: L,D-transpeptidase family protein [Rhizobiaceae bacterium]|nr:L,D-transpeptidase family protein [Rhizobiaceae bacterium]